MFISFPDDLRMEKKFTFSKTLVSEDEENQVYFLSYMSSVWKKRRNEWKKTDQLIKVTDAISRQNKGSLKK